MTNNRKICVGMIAGSHGVRGLVRLRSFTEEPEDILAYGTLTDEEGKSFDIDLKSAAKDFFIASFGGVTTKEQADALRGTRLYAAREAMPKTGKREYYEADLIGLAVKSEDGKDLGKVRGVFNYGAGPFLEIGTGKADSFMLPFTDAFVPEVNIKLGIVLIKPPRDWITKKDPV